MSAQDWFRLVDHETGAERIQHVGDAHEIAWCGATFRKSPGEWFGRFPAWNPTCVRCIAVYTIRKQYGEVPWWRVLRRLQRRSAVMAVRRAALPETPKEETR